MEKKLIDLKQTIYDMKILIKEYSNNKFCALIGLNSPNTKSNEDINFISELKKSGIINDYSWTFIFFSSGAGQLVIGGLPHEYMNNSKFFKQKQYIKLKSESIMDYNFPWSIIFNQIFFEIKKEKIIIQNNAKAYLIPNLGFIIGTYEYRKYIIENYFQFLFNDNVCQIEKSKDNNITNVFKNKAFEVFSCQKYKFEKKKIEINFPNLKLIQKDKLNYTFSLSFFDLFIKIKDKYYFLIIFPEDILQSKGQDWYLGLPFHKNYQFIFNYDSKTIGFYAYRSEYEHEELKNNKPIEIGDIKINTNLKSYSYKRVIIEIFICIILIIIAYFIGKKIRKERKKKANELKDDNYEYFSSDINSNMNNNKINMKSKYNEINSNNKLLEMSSSMNSN